MSRTRHIQQLWTYKFAQGRKTIETTKIKKNYQKMCKNARVLLFEVTLGGVEAEFFFFFNFEDRDSAEILHSDRNT